MFRQTLKSQVYWGALVLALAAGWVASTAQAAMILGPPVPLSSLINNPTASVVAGDKTFTGFTYSFIGDMPGPAGVNVIPIRDDDGYYGIRFQGAFIDLPSSQGGSDAFIEYMVEAGPGRLISDAHVRGNPNVLGNVGSISVTETFLPLGQNGEYTMEIFDDENLDQAKLVDWVFFNPPVKKLNVQKDILALASPNGQSATMSFCDQTFSQTPEATTLALAVVGAVCVAALRRRREWFGLARV